MQKGVQKKLQRSRFTLVELLTVMAIIAVLVGIVLSLMGMATRKMSEARTKSVVQQVCNALENYKAKYGYYLQTQGVAKAFYLDLVNSSAAAGAADNITGNFCNFIDYEMMRNKDSQIVGTPGTDRYWLVDGFGYPIVYRCPGYFNRSGFDIGSGGIDGCFGSTTKGVLSFDDAKYKSDFGKGDDIVNFTRK